MEGVVQGCRWVCAGVAVLLMGLNNKESEILLISISLPVLIIYSILVSFFSTPCFILTRIAEFER